MFKSVILQIIAGVFALTAGYFGTELTRPTETQRWAQPSFWQWYLILASSYAVMLTVIGIGLGYASQRKR